MKIVLFFLILLVQLQDRQIFGLLLLLIKILKGPCVAFGVELIFDCRSTLVRINKELSFKYQFNDNIPEDYQELQILFKKLLEKISEDNTKPALVLIIDALNQLGLYLC